MLQDSLPAFHLASYKHRPHARPDSPSPPVNVSNKLGNESGLCPEPGGETVVIQESQCVCVCQRAESVATFDTVAPQHQHGKLPWKRCFGRWQRRELSEVEERSAPDEHQHVVHQLSEVNSNALTAENGVWLKVDPAESFSTIVQHRLPADFCPFVILFYFLNIIYKPVSVIHFSMM